MEIAEHVRSQFRNNLADVTFGKVAGYQQQWLASNLPISTKWATDTCFSCENSVHVARDLT